MHTRQVCDSRDKKGDCTSYRTEEYWTWDTVGVWRYASPEWDFLNVTFARDQLEMTDGNMLILDSSTMNGKDGFYNSWHLYEQSLWGYPTGDDRYYFKVVPIGFVCTIFSRFVGDTASDPITGSKVMRVYESMTPAQIIQSKKDGLVVFDVFYFSFSVIVCVGVWYYLAYDRLDI